LEKLMGSIGEVSGMLTARQSFWNYLRALHWPITVSPSRWPPGSGSTTAVQRITGD